MRQKKTALWRWGSANPKFTVVQADSYTGKVPASKQSNDVNSDFFFEQLDLEDNGVKYTEMRLSENTRLSADFILRTSKRNLSHSVRTPLSSVCCTPTQQSSMVNIDRS
ncbi:hypothetical protein BLNAU_25250 [Blattamonas nauphoetae]|uniref:Uncharacterized protein n=1 Tax=Blattamonas nauphoetae TaxID=2049346 RepID=A0ABQ9WK53_9EUKA|nr:hypothetical protein BLNAU_25250 [Blattamonas nauphoetae]